MAVTSTAKPSDEDFARAARAALPQWRIDVDDIKLVGFVENVVYRVRAGDGNAYVLRLHRPGYHTRAELESEQTWTEALNVAGIAAPQPLRTLDGARYVVVDVANGTPRHAGVSRWQPGQPMGDVMERSAEPDDIARQFERLGTLAAHVHNQAASWTPPASFERHALDAAGLVGETPWWGRFWESPAIAGTARTQLITLRAAAQEYLEALPCQPATYSLIHADLHPGNILVRDDDLSIIDFDDAGFGWHSYELAVALYRYESDQDFGRYRDALLRGYQKERAIPADILEQILMFMMVRAMQTIGWLNDRPELNADHRVPMLVDKALRLARQLLLH